MLVLENEQSWFCNGRSNALVSMAKRKLPNCRLVLSGVLWRRDVSWQCIGVLNDRFDWVANALGPTFVDLNSWIEDRDFTRDGLHLNGRGKRRLGQLRVYARGSGLDVRGLAGSKKWQILEKGNHRMRNTRETCWSSIEKQKTLHEEDRPVNSNLMSREVEVGSRV